jgi:hypothetical protein
VKGYLDATSRDHQAIVKAHGRSAAKLPAESGTGVEDRRETQKRSFKIVPRKLASA